MEKEIIIGMMLIQTLLEVRVTSVDSNKQEFELPSFYLGKKEKEVVRHMVSDMPDQSICFLEDSMMVSYTLASIKGELILIGPYRKECDYNQFNALPFFQMRTSKELQIQFKEEYENLTLLEDEKVKSALHTFFLGVYGYLDYLVERKIELRQYINELDGDISELYDWNNQKKAYDVVQDKAYQCQLISYIERGNYQGAIEAYKEIVRHRIQEKGLGLDVLEGLTSARNLIEIAMHNAGVPIPAYAKLGRQYQLKCRGINQKNDAQKIVSKFISQACELVHFYSSKQYSKGVCLAIAHIHLNLNEKIMIEQIASECAMSISWLSTCFKKEVGMTITEYIMEQRMIQASKLLIYTNLSIQGIASKVGIEDNNYFARCFKKQFGVNPTAYRKKYFPVEDQ